MIETRNDPALKRHQKDNAEDPDASEDRDGGGHDDALDQQDEEVGQPKSKLRSSICVPLSQ